MKRFITFIFFCSFIVFSQQNETDPESIIGKMVKITGDVNCLGVIENYKKNDFVKVEITPGYGDVYYTWNLKGLHCKIEILADSRAEYKKKKKAGIINEKAIYQEFASNRCLFEAEEENTRKAYEKVIKKFPGSEAATEAELRVNDPIHAFIKTIESHYPLNKTMEGFCTLHPESVLQPFIDSYWQYNESWRIKKGGLLDFSPKYPENPWCSSIFARIPAIRLKVENAKIGIRINVGNITNKGLLGSLVAPTKPEKVKKKLVDWISETCTKEGIPYIMIAENTTIPTFPEISHLVEISYAEEKRERKAKTDSAQSPSQVLDAHTTSNILSVLDSPYSNNLKITLMKLDKKKDFYESFTNIDFDSIWWKNAIWWHYPNNNPDWTVVFQDKDSSPEARLARLTLFRNNLNTYKDLDGFEKEAQQIISEYLANNKKTN